MSSTANPMTAHQLLSLPSGRQRYELIEGQLRVMSPAGNRHGYVAMRLGSLLDQHVTANQLGRVFAAETGFLLATNPDTVRAPDVAFVHRDRLLPFADWDGYLPIAPDLAAEVVSPNDLGSEVEAKVRCWLDAGTKVVLVVDPRERTLRAYQSGEAAQCFGERDEFAAQSTSPGWGLRVGDLFAD